MDRALFLSQPASTHNTERTYRSYDPNVCHNSGDQGRWRAECPEHKRMRPSHQTSDWGKQHLLDEQMTKNTFLVSQNCPVNLMRGSGVLFQHCCWAQHQMASKCWKKLSSSYFRCLTSVKILPCTSHVSVGPLKNTWRSVLWPEVGEREMCVLVRGGCCCVCISLSLQETVFLGSTPHISLTKPSHWERQHFGPMLQQRLGPTDFRRGAEDPQRV